MKRRMLLAATLAVGACGPQTPAYQDPLADLTSVKGAAVPENAPVQAGPTQAMTFGSNVERYIKFHDDGIKFAASMGAGPKVLKDSSPQYLIDGGTSILRQRYPAIRPVDDLATAQRERIATTFVLDIKTTFGTVPGTKNTCEITLIAFNAQQQPISRIVSRGEITIPGFVVPDVKAAYDMALTNFKAKVDSLCS
ncbi:hypothetical protein BH11PSE3_BH11PSE3_28530 [soil metagenome]